MAVSLKHQFTSNVADSPDATLVQPSNWNAEHTLTANANSLLGTVTAGAVTEIACTAAGRALLDDADAAAQRTTLAAAGTGVTNTFTANQIVEVTDNTNAALRVTQLGTGNAILVEDSANPDSTPFVVDASGQVGIGVTPAFKLDVLGADIVGRFSSTTGSVYVGLVNNANSQGYIGYEGSGGTNMTFYTANAERLRIGGSGQIGLGGANYGTAGQSLISNGSGSAPSWGGVGLPQNSQTTAYVLVASDNGKHISITTGGVTVPASVFAVGDTVTIYNNSGSSQTITQGASVTLRQAGTTNTGNRTLANYGLATILCVASGTFVINGGGIS